MALFETETVNGNSPYAEFKIGEMELKEAMGFMFLARDTATSAEYGDFNIWQGLKFDTKAETEEALLGSLSLYDTTAFDHILTAHGVTIPEDRVNPIDLEAIDDMVSDLTRVNPLLARAVHDTVASAWSGVTL